MSGVMLPELYRTFETGTLKDLVSYGDHPVNEEPGSEESIRREDDASRRRRDFGKRRRSRPSRRGKKRRWARLGGRLLSKTGRS